MDFRIFWKVHRNNFKSFTTYVDNYYNKYNYYYLEYDRSKGYIYNLYTNRVCDYIFIGLATTRKDGKDVIVVSSEVFSYNLLQTLTSNKWVYKGEYNGRKEKLERLNKLSGM